ncbi:MAG: DUF3040 domain-containing protein [Actinomycetota bacterium]
MPLSDREQQILAEIEKNLSSDDPRLARQAARRDLGLKAGALLFLAGFALLIGFFVSRSVLIGVAAFAAMVSGIVLLIGALGGFVKEQGRKFGLPDAWSKLRARIRKRYERS